MFGVLKFIESDVVFVYLEGIEVFTIHSPEKIWERNDFGTHCAFLNCSITSISQVSSSR